MAATKKATTTKVTTAKATTQKIAPAAAPEVKTIKPAAPVATAKPVVSAPATTKTAGRTISQGEWRSMVEQAAYYIAEKSGFSGNPEDHWAAAEAQVRSELTAKSIKVA